MDNTGTSASFKRNLIDVYTRGIYKLNIVANAAFLGNRTYKRFINFRAMESEKDV